MLPTSRILTNRFTDMNNVGYLAPSICFTVHHIYKRRGGSHGSMVVNANADKDSDNESTVATCNDSSKGFLPITNGQSPMTNQP